MKKTIGKPIILMQGELEVVLYPHVVRYIDRKTKKAIKSLWNHQAKITKRMNYVNQCIESEYDFPYMDDGDIDCNPTIDGYKARVVVEAYREELDMRAIVHY